MSATPAIDKQRLGAIIDRLAKEAEDRVSKRRWLEQRWIEDLRQFHGQYDGTLLTELSDQGKSQLFINETRPKTVTLAARLFDLLYPTDDRNWDIAPTPVPSLADQVAEGGGKPREMVDLANHALKTGDPARAEAIATEANMAADAADAANAVIADATKRADAMRAEMEDQLEECGYNAECREIIEDMCKVGAGVIEGPVVADRVRRVWAKQPVTGPDGVPVVNPDGTPLEGWAMSEVTDPRPAFRRIDYWGFFPQPGALKPEESDSFFVRRLMTEKQMRRLSREPGFFKDEIEALLSEGIGKGAAPAYVQEIQDIHGAAADTSDKFVVWEYRGPVTAEELRNACGCLGAGDDARRDKYAALAGLYQEASPLDEIEAVVWFCQGRCLKFGINHMDRGGPIYAVVPLEKDDASMFGLGVPALMRDPQSALNAAWRMMIDNAALSAGPQIEVDRQVGDPTDGSWKLYARKIWERIAGAPADRPLLRLHEIQSRQAEIANIITLSRTFIDTNSGVPQIIQGEAASHVTRTVGGMAMLQSAANVLIRRFVKNIDDRLTVPCMKRLYDWNMQFSPRDDLKGDFEVKARGSSALVVRELQSNNLMSFSLQFGGHPVFGSLIKHAEVLRETAKAMMVPADKIVKTEDEIKQAADAAKQTEPPPPQPPPPPPQPQPPDPKVELKAEEIKLKREVAQMEHERAMMELAARQNMKLNDIRGMLTKAREQLKSKEKMFAAEATLESRRPGTGGSGGYFSGLAP